MIAVDEEKLKSDFENMFAPAELHTELVPYLTESEHFKMLRHPLVFAVPYSEEMNNYYNTRYELMKTELVKALKEGNLHRYVFMHERPHRVDAFVYCIANRVVKDTDYWELLGAIWIDSENIWQNQPIWRRLLKSGRLHKHRFMDADERKEFKKLPNRLTVYRGCVCGQNENGMSWTLDKAKAEWFSRRYLRTDRKERPCVLEKTINKSRVFAHLTGRSESEIILL